MLLKTAMDPKGQLIISEIFHSLQGESSLIGIPFAFIRLTGCNLRCSYCDSAYAFNGGDKLSFAEILARIEPFQVKHVLLTGGEPLLQKNLIHLIYDLRAKEYEVSIETHGELPILPVVSHARIIMDIKTPSSGMSKGAWRDNLKWLKPTDEIKFVVASKEDYYWAREIVQKDKLPTKEIIFSPAMACATAPGKYPGVDPKWLAEQILADHLQVRFQLQLHKLLWGADKRGV